MVWHSYMLNPRNFLEDCIRNLKMDFWRAGLPWIAINSCIDNQSLEYSGTQNARQLFEKTTGFAWNSLDDSPNAIIDCPKCGQRLSVPWTTCGEYPSWEDQGDESGSGFADKMFALLCVHCKITIDHEKLRGAKFRKNLNELLKNDCPMPGTILGVDG